MAMHENEIPLSDDAARRLIDSQLPQYAGRELRRLPPIGTDHHLFRVGDDLLARFPKIDWAADQAESDDTWLRRLAPHLPLEVPVPVAMGAPADDYPFRWSVVPWIEGENPTKGNIDELACARTLGEFARALHEVDPMGGPVKSGTQRGVPLAACDDWVREWTAKAGDRIDQQAVLAVWEDALAAPVWEHDPVWLCGDIQEGNVIVRDGEVVAAIDFGALGRGDPAAELMPCWNWFSGEASAAYRDANALDEAAYRRGRGWALVPSVSALTYYETTSPAHAIGSAETIAAVLREFSER
jgi:aminoglycoside phosphotransferase (APT) family kinase protein